MTERAAIVGRELFVVFPDDPDEVGATGVGNLRASLDRVRATRAPDTMPVQRYSIRRPAEQGGGFEERHWSPINTPVLGADGAVRWIVHRVEDVTGFVKASERGAAAELEVLQRTRELEAALRDLREAHARQGELDQAKSEFFDNVSHEFRTPLTLLLAPAEDLLADRAEPLTPSQRERVGLIHQHAQRMLKLVNALLDFARFGAGRAEARFEPTDLVRSTREMVSAFESLYQRAGIELRWQCTAPTITAFVDRAMWEKIVLNLLSNALKYTTRGSVIVRLSATPSDAVLEVQDTGIGIPDGELSNMFQRFHRVRSEGARTIEGTGIGLALVAALARVHGGEVGVRSRFGAGSTFSVQVPLGRDHHDPARVVEWSEDRVASREAALYVAESGAWLEDVEHPHRHAYAAAPAPASASTAARPRVLVVDDNADLRRLLQRLLQPHYEVQLAEDGEAALALVRASRPDLVLSDAIMPRLDGFGLLRALKTDPATRAIPVILLSGRAEQDGHGVGGPHDADDYLLKPFANSELIARVRKQLELAQARAALTEDLERTRAERDALLSRPDRD